MINCLEKYKCGQLTQLNIKLTILPALQILWNINKCKAIIVVSLEIATNIIIFFEN